MEAEAGSCFHRTAWSCQSRRLKRVYQTHMFGSLQSNVKTFCFKDIFKLLLIIIIIIIITIIIIIIIYLLILRRNQRCCFQLRITIVKKMKVTVNESILHEYQQYQNII